ncbi:unnamed protein product [Hymenolepis diminuta]|uniref:Uncharacterized protein n=1 Tax=Hymenolepis diminuta TaxID=6216 RepID=A0A564Y4Q5_HYMDI|nr:unnamed protein product [Hymenolepis diminuta]
MKIPQETNTTGSAKGIVGSIDQIRRRILYATALNTCEPWEQKLAFGVILVLFSSFFLSLFIFIPSEMIVFVDFFLNKTLSHTDLPAK